MEEKFAVIAIFKAKESKEAALLNVLKKAVLCCRAENANIESHIYQNTEDRMQFFLYENWESKKKYEELFEKVIFKNLIAEVKTLLDGTLQVCFGSEI